MIRDISLYAKSHGEFSYTTTTNVQKDGTRLALFVATTNSTVLFCLFLTAGLRAGDILIVQAIKPSAATVSGVVPALSPEEERALYEKFEEALLEYNSDERAGRLSRRGYSRYSRV